MTDNMTDEDIKDSNNAAIEPEAELIDDPIIAEMREAEKEIEALESGKAEQEAETGAKAADTPKADAPKDKGNMPVVPKARFDEVLSERDLLRDQVGYLRGLNDAKEQMKTPPNQDKPSTETNKEVQNDSKVDEIETAITAAEQKKLEYAEKYDAGDISTVELRKAEIEIDREIRGLTDKREVARLTTLQEVGRTETQAALTAQQQAEWINSQALVVSQNHPNISVIDATPKLIRDAIWQQIDAQARQNLLQRGVNVNQNSPATKLELIKEKASLTDSYTPEKLTAFLPAGYQSPAQPQQPTNGQNNPSPKQPSETALQRAKKLELAESQPPTVADMGHGTTDGNLTEADIEGMTEDQIADILQKAPNLIKRAVGSSI